MKEFIKYTIATIVGMFITFFFLGVLLFFTVMGFISSAGKKTAAVKDNSVLELSLDYDIPERTNFDISLFLNPEDDVRYLGLDRILELIKRAAQDPKIKGIYLKTNISGTGYATTLEIRNALAAFKSKGKFIYACAPFYDEKNYYLASIADSVFIETSGNVLFNGLTANIMFFKGALEKAGVEMQYVKVGAYKGAVEAFTRTDLSPENRAQISEYLQHLYGDILQRIGESRHLDTGAINKAFSDFSIQTPAAAKAFGLIDRLVYEDEVKASISRKMGVKAVSDLSLIKASAYSHEEDSETDGKDRIAVVYAVGEIIDGNGNQSTVGSESMAKAIAKAREDKHVKAIVLRVNSPGGSSSASDIIAREIALCKGVKPVVVSMGDVAASGGYYISALADTILALPNTITGSIGVFGLFPNMHGLLTEKMGLSFETVKTGKHSDFGRVDRPLTETDRLYLQNMVNKIYDEFTGIVEKGRHLDSAKVESIAQGRVWTAVQARQHGLIDAFGGIDDAVKLAAHMSRTKTYGISVYPKIDNPILQMLQGAGNQMMEKKMSADLGILYSFYKTLQTGMKSTGFQMRLPFDLCIQ